MSIKINHRFLNRLNSTENYKDIRTIIIGTFNPGIPELDTLNETETKQFNQIKSSSKFKRFDEIRNFYDRPQNRFWKVMDFVNSPDFYSRNSIEIPNINGLKFYKNVMDRDEVFLRQKTFCENKGIFITDIAQTINPISFCDIYDNFPDTAIERADPIWNTNMIIEIIENYNPKKIIVNFKPNGKSIPNICAQIKIIEDRFPGKIVMGILSTSGAAGNKYEDLIHNWKPHLE